MMLRCTGKGALTNSKYDCKLVKRLRKSVRSFWEKKKNRADGLCDPACPSQVFTQRTVSQHREILPLGQLLHHYSQEPHCEITSGVHQEECIQKTGRCTHNSISFGCRLELCHL